MPAIMVIISCPPSRPLLRAHPGFCGHELDDVHVFDLDARAWRCASIGAGCCLGGGGGGGASASASAVRPCPRSVFGAAVHACGSARHDACAHSGSVLMFGGEVDPSTQGHAGAGGFSAELWGLDAEGMTWRQLAADGQAPSARGWVGSCAVDGALVVHGGVDVQNRRLADMHLLKL